MQRADALEAIFVASKVPEQAYEIMLAWADEIEAYGADHPHLSAVCSDTAESIRGRGQALINMFGMEARRAWADLPKRALRLNRHRQDQWIQAHIDALRLEGQAMVREALRGLKPGS